MHEEENKVKRFIDRIRQIHIKVHNKIEKSQEKYKLHHDQHRIDHKLCVGDKGFLYLNKERMQGKPLCGICLDMDYEIA